jgi:bifunctional DNA-binding transcriptional regulator/antitoxin component of YhaV-PrlF toxin-antitoxin module
MNYMPQLVKGGKYVFGWSVIGKDGRIPLPGEARIEYKIRPRDKVVLISGSRTSGGFSVCKESQIEQSKLSEIYKLNSELVDSEEGKIIVSGGRVICRVSVDEDNQLLLSPSILNAYRAAPEGRLLSVRGSFIGIGMIVKGPIVKEALNHPEIPVFEVD